MPLDVWDGQRPLTPRILLRQDEVVSRGLHLRYVSERIETPTDWCSLDDARHRLYVHRGGRLNSMHTGADWGPDGRELPKIGDLWIVPAGERSSSLVQGGEAAEYCEISVPIGLLGDPATMPRVKRRDPFIHQVTERIVKTVGRTDAMAGLLADSLAEALRLHIVDAWTVRGRRRLRRRSGRDPLDSALQRALVEFIEDALDTEITLEAMANIAAMPVGHFIKEFVAAFHTTPYQFLLDRRIDRAKALLLNTTRSIAEISAAVGFSTPNHFATVFRRRVGASPTTFRRGR